MGSGSVGVDGRCGSVFCTRVFAAAVTLDVTCRNDELRFVNWLDKFGGKVKLLNHDDTEFCSSTTGAAAAAALAGTTTFSSVGTDDGGAGFVVVSGGADDSTVVCSGSFVELIFDLENK